MSSTSSYTFPFFIIQLSVFLVGSYGILFPLPLAVREAHEILTSKAEVETLLWGNHWGYPSAKAKYRAFLPVSNTALSCEGRLQKPLLLQVRSYKARKMNTPCLFQGRGKAHTIQGSKIWSSRSNTFRIYMLVLDSSVIKQW